MAMITLSLSPGGPGCSHVLIQDDKGFVLRTITMEELVGKVEPSDDYLLAQIKRVAQDTKISDPESLKEALETKEFDI